jgi:toxin ParE2
MQVKFSTAAEDELDEATLYYEQAMPGLGAQFRAEVARSARQLGQMPLLWAEVWPPVRRCLLSRFPYALLYAVEADYVFVIAVAHQHRKPGYWRDRVSKQ